MKKAWQTAISVLFLASAATAAERVFPLNPLTQHEASDKDTGMHKAESKKVIVKAVGKNVYEWSLPDGLQQNLNFNLPKLGLKQSSRRS